MTFIKIYVLALLVNFALTCEDNIDARDKFDMDCSWYSENS